MSEQPHDDALNAYWNALVRGADEPHVGDLDPDDAETLHQLHAVTHTPPPAWAQSRVDAAMQEHLRSHQNGHANRGLEETTPIATWTPPNGAHDAQAWRVVPTAVSAAPLPRLGIRWVRTQFATLGLLLLTLRLGLVTLHPRSGLPDLLAQRPGPGETLVALTLPAEMVPSGASTDWELAHITIPPGLHSTWDGANDRCCRGTRVEYVLQGTYTVRPAGPAQVVRADGTGTSEIVPADTDVTLRVGEAIIAPSENAYAARNAGATPVELLSGLVMLDTTTNQVIPAGWITHDIDEVFDLAVPVGPATLRLLRSTLAPDAIFPVPPTAVGQVAVTLEAEVALGKQRDGSLRNITAQPLTAYMLTLEPLGAGSHLLDTTMPRP